MPGFIDAAIFPVNVSQGSPGGPDWPAEIIEHGSGFEDRNTPWSSPLRRYDARFGVRTQAELYEVLSLYHVAMGRIRGFRFLDWTDYRSGGPQTSPSALDQGFGTGTGAQTIFQLTKRYTFAAEVMDRKITRPYGAVKVAVNGAEIFSGFSVAPATGLVTFTTAPAAAAVLTWGGTFHVPVRFDCTLDQVSLRTVAVGDIPSIFLKELRE